MGKKKYIDEALRVRDFLKLKIIIGNVLNLI